MLSQVNACCVRCDALNITDVCHPINLVNEFVGPHFDFRVHVPDENVECLNGIRRLLIHGVPVQSNQTELFSI